MANIQRFTIRATSHSLAFMKPGKDGIPLYLPYVSKSRMSVAANLRTAVKEESFFEDAEEKVLLSVCSPVLLVPKNEYLDDENFDAAKAFDFTFTQHEHEEKISNVLPSLNAVAVFSVNKDLKLVVDDNFTDVRIQNVMQPVWEHLYRHSQLVPQRRKLYGYFHDGLLDIFSFQHNRFLFSNAFAVTHEQDAIYFLLFVWKHLGFNNEEDEMYIVGEFSDFEKLTDTLKQFLRCVYVINPSAELNRDAVTQIKNLPYDLML